MKDQYGLTQQQRMFADFYRADPDRNGTAAYRRAYPKCRAAAAKASASRLLTDVNVFSYVRKLDEIVSKKLQITAERVLQELARLSFYDPRKFFNYDGSLKAITELDADTAMSLESFDSSVKKDGEEFVTVWKIKFANKGTNLDKLAKYLGLYERNNKQKINPIKELLDQIDGNKDPLVKE